MGFIVGGEEYDLDRKRVETVMRKVEPESLQKHVVELFGKAYPPKQVFAEVTGRRRATFTTQEAIRVLSRLGFTCREVGHQYPGSSRLNAEEESKVYSPSAPSLEDRLASVEGGLATIHLAIERLQQRIAALENK